MLNNKPFKFSKKSLERLEGVDGRLIDVMEMALAISKIDFGIPAYGGYRTAREQRILFYDGKTKANGTSHKSKHQSGNAVDVYAYVDGKASWKEEYLTHIAAAVLQAAIKLDTRVQWGGLWVNFVDCPHFERIS